MLCLFYARFDTVGFNWICSVIPSFCYFALIRFRLISLKGIDKILLNFICNLKLTRSKLRLIFSRFVVTSLQPLIECQNFVSSQYFDSDLTEFDAYTLIFTRSLLGLLLVLIVNL